LVFKNARVCFLGSDDFTVSEKAKAASDLSAALAGEWSGYSIARRLSLEEVAQAHLAVESGTAGGRVILDLFGAAV